jgi:amino acid transporter
MNQRFFMDWVQSFRERFFKKSENQEETPSIDPPSSARFGTFTGVFIPNITMMFGVILFLRLGLITAYTGTFMMSVIIITSALIMLLTSFSITSIVTNMRVGGGGVYYLISRSLGIEIGGALGVILYLSQVISIALCTSGFAYSIHELLPAVPINAIELVTLVALSVLSFFSADWALKIQTLIFALIMAAVVSVFLPTVKSVALVEGPLYFPQGISFWTAFAMFFPAMTGIEAGMAMSGSLKTPSRSLAIGNIISVVVAFSVYLSLSLYIYNIVPVSVLQRNPMVLLEYVRWPAMIYVGIWAATLSSVLGGILGAPRMLQTIAEDKIVPSFLAKTHGPLQEPRIATIVTFILAIIVTYGTSIDQIIPILAMVRLITYCILNLVAAFCELINSPSWRPKVRVPWWISALGAAACLFVMFMIDAGWTFGAMTLVTVGYLILAKRKMQVAFRDIRSSVLFYFARLALYRLAKRQEEANHWHPQLLVFSHSPQNQEKMNYICHEMTKQSGVLTFAAILPVQWSDPSRLATVKATLKDHYEKNQLSCLLEVLDSSAPFEGMIAMAKSYGIGPIHPNTIVMGMPKANTFQEGFYELLQIAKGFKKNIILFHDSEAVSIEVYKKAKRAKPFCIDIWWDADYRGSFELMLSYLKILTDSTVWKAAQITIKATAQSENSRESLDKHFQNYLEENRLDYRIKIYVENSVEAYWKNINHYSHETDLVYLALRPLESFGTKEAYEEYYQHLQSVIDQMPPTMLISWYDGIDHKNIY